MQVHRNDTVLECRLCGRTLLLGERAVSYQGPGGVGAVCELCVDEADALGWRRDGAREALPEVVRPERGAGWLARLLRRSPPPRAPIVREREDAIVSDPERPVGPAQSGVEVFNSSQHRRTVSGISKSLGEPRVSVVPLAGARPDVVVTVAWELSWYQYRVDAAGGIIRLEGRGDDPDDLDERWQRWNARLASDGRLAIAV
jgi:hypothetical protein